MSSVDSSKSLATDRGLELPGTLQQKLADFRGYVRITKLTEALVWCAIVCLGMYLTTYLLDRLGDTAWAVRCLLFMTALAIWILIPYGLYRWAWGSRRWDQLARLLRKRNYSVGDQLLSVIELSTSREEQRRSPELCLAAMRQVAQRVEGQDLRTAAPKHFLMPLTCILAIAGSIALILLWWYPSAAYNAWLRFSRPWQPVPRYTFAAVEALPEAWVVPHGEASMLPVRLKSDSEQRPEFALATIGGAKAVLQEVQASLQSLAAEERGDNGMQLSASASASPHTSLQGDDYRLELPPLVAPTPMRLAVGDYSQWITLEPRHRPELTDLTAEVSLPDYLQIPQASSLDVRAGVLSAVQGSTFRLKARASGALQAAWIAERQVPVAGEEFQTEPQSVGADSFDLHLNWQDEYGLSSRRPLQLQIRAVPDELPSIAAQGLPRQAVILDSEQINFSALAADDFGVQQVGIAWKGLDPTLVVEPAIGEKVIAGGGPEQAAMQVPATFCAAALGIAAQPLEVTVWVKDYSPEHPAVHSAAHILYVLTPDQHAIWITTQISKWQRSALEVRDTEMQLFQANQQLRLDAQNVSDPALLQEEIRRQAALEDANGRKLSALTQSGTQLLQQASRNPDVSVDNIQQMAQLLEVLGDIAHQRMPGVADLLKQAAQQVDSQAQQSTASSSDSPSQESSRVGQMRAGSGAGQADQESPAQEPESQTQPSNKLPGSPLPAIVDVESNMHSPDSLKATADSGQSKAAAEDGGRIGMLQTTLSGPVAEGGESTDSSDASPKEDSPEKIASQQPMDLALQEQLDLLAEFEKIADELNAVLGNLEGSTLVKRLKAASREQVLVAEKIASRIESIFGRSKAVSPEDQSVLVSLTEAQRLSSQAVSFIMDDMQAYFERRKIPQIKSVLDEMKSSDVLAAIRKLGDDLQAEHGLSIAQAEYWADTLDRWAEDLVETPESKGEESSSESKDSMPPAMVLEMLRILEGEVNLREETRVAEQACKVVSEQQHQEEATRLAKVQSGLRDRTNTLADQISMLPGAEQNFAQEMLLFSTASQVMEEVRTLLSLGNTGNQTMAGQTEVIELLLQSQRINPQGGGGGGGTSPGGGGTGTTQDSALALLGTGLNPNERLEARDVGQGVGKASDRVFPEEFRGGLDAYFQKLESTPLNNRRSALP